MNKANYTEFEDEESFQTFKTSKMSRRTFDLYFHSITDFLKYTKLGSYDKLIQLSRKDLQRHLISWIRHDVDRGLKGESVRTKMAGIEWFFDVNDVVYNKKLVRLQITKAVITVPAYFNDNQRQATKAAGEIAGLDVIRVMTEPVAAAVSYGLDKIKEPTKVLVFDMGAGTLDVSVLESDSGYFEVIGTGGDTNLGGIDMDKEISNYLLDEYKKQNGLNVSVDEVTSLQINQLAEKIKIDLTENEEVTVNERFFSNNSQTALKLKITRNDFEKLIEEPILKKCGECIYNVLNDLKMSSDKINKVILVGGPTRIPALRTFISKILKEPESGVDPEFSVARGAAIEGAVLANDSNLPVLYQGLTLLNVTPLDLGEKAVMKDSELGIKLMIPRNTTYPTEVTKTFYKQFPNSPKIAISVWEGDFQNNYGFYGNVNLGSFWLYVPQREGLEIEVTYKIDTDGILTVSAVEKSTGNRDSLKVERGSGPSIPPPQLESFSKEAETFEEEYKKTSYDVLSPYEIPIRNDNNEFSKRGQTSRGENSQTEWLYEALGKAQKIINTHHQDQSDYFAKCNFQFRFDQETDDAFGYVDGTFPNYVIGIHELFSKPMPEDKRFVTMTIVHELLHVIHNDWPEKR